MGAEAKQHPIFRVTIGVIFSSGMAQINISSSPSLPGQTEAHRFQIAGIPLRNGVTWGEKHVRALRLPGTR
jgi:hypothetical protein